MTEITYRNQQTQLTLLDWLRVEYEIEHLLATSTLAWISQPTQEQVTADSLADERYGITAYQHPDSSSTVRTLPDDKFSKNAGFFMRVNRPISKCSAKF